MLGAIGLAMLVGSASLVGLAALLLVPAALLSRFLRLMQTPSLGKTQLRQRETDPGSRLVTGSST
jgi:hypothetical protein